MAKRFRLTAEDIEAATQKFAELLRGAKSFDGTLTFKEKLAGDDRSAIIMFTQTAWIKMTSLVVEFSTEVEWHGLVRRISPSTFEVYDIIVPPHTVSSSTVTADNEKYSAWLDGLDDNTFNAIKFHGHSHVNMGVTPSGVDTKYRTDLVTGLPNPTADDDIYYMFMIINKRHEWTAQIYDLTNNAVYDTDDIEIVTLLDNDLSVDTFLYDAKKQATTAPAPVRTPAYESPYGGAYGGYDGYGWGQYGGYGGKAKEKAKENKPKAKGKPAQKDDTFEELRAKYGYSAYGDYPDYDD